MGNITNAVKKNWKKYFAIFLAPVIAVIVSLSYFIVKSDDFLTVQSNDIKNHHFLPEILSGQKYIQKIHSDQDGLVRISLLISTFKRINNSNLYISLTDDKGDVVQDWKLKNNLLRNNSYRTISLDNRIENSRDKDYYLIITSDASHKNGITIGSNNANNKGLSLNGKELNVTLCYRLSYREPFVKLFNKANALHVSIIIVLAYIIFTLLPLLSKIRIENAFLGLWCFLSLMYLFAATPFNIPDEVAHFFRSFDVSYGRILSKVNDNGNIGGELPLPPDLNWNPTEYVLTKNWQSFADHSNQSVNKEFVFKSFPNTALYSPMTYLPQAMGIFFSRHLTTNLPIIIYCGRLFNWVFITIVLYAAIRMIPIGKEILALIALIPINIYESISLASDGQVVAISILMVSYVLYLRYKQNFIIRAWQYLLLWLLALMISQLKILYFPFILLYFLIPKERFGSNKKKLYHLGAIILFALAANMIWLTMCSKFIRFSARGDTSEQLAFIILNPLYYLNVLARTFFNSGSDFINTMMGSVLSWKSLSVTTVKIFIQVFVCILTYKFINNRKKLAASAFGEAIIFSFITLSIIILISTSEYLYWTAPYSKTISGIQGRYFIPLLLPLYFVINNPLSYLQKNKNTLETFSVNITSFMTCFNLCACIALLFNSLSL